MPKPKPARCLYREGNQRCRRNGLGKPPLCRVHREVFEHVSQGPTDDRPGAAFVGVLRDFFAGRKVSNERMAAGAADAFDVYMRARREAAGGADPRGAPWRGMRDGWPGARQRVPPPPPAPPRDAHHRALLGFPPGAVLTEDEINRRRRKLALQFHPDKPGGSVARMAEINAAADALLEQIG